MKNIRNLKLALLVICCTLLASCNLIDFSEDCIYYGDVEIKPDWTESAKENMKPALTDVYFLSSANNYNYCISADTLIRNIQAATYKVLAFNSYGLSDINFSGMDCPLTAKAEIRTYQQDEKLYTVQAPALYTAETDLTVIPFESVVSKPVLKSAIRQINIDFIVIDNANAGINTISGELSGIAYRYGFKESDALTSAAWLAFESEFDAEKSNVFSSHLKVLGINPDKQPTDRIDNLLEIGLQIRDGKIYKETINLTNVFNDFTTRIINITIEIRLGIMSMEANITGWNVADGGNIEL